jgi:CMP-N-acetylneuraminic acid synthetase
MSTAASIAVQVPIKHRSSERIPNKNFHPFHGKPLCYWVLDELARHCPPAWDLYVDSEDEAVYAKLAPAHRERFRFHQRPAWYAGNEANGNHLLQQFAAAHSQYACFVQVYITAALLRGATVVSAVEALLADRRHDSVLLATEETGFLWFRDVPVNYDPHTPNGLPRSQDIRYVKETTGLYAVRREVALSKGCRVGDRPMFYMVPRLQGLDIDTLEDLQLAERLFERP